MRARRWRYGLPAVAVTSGYANHRLGRWANNVQEDVGKDKGWVRRRFLGHVSIY